MVNVRVAVVVVVVVTGTKLVTGVRVVVTVVYRGRANVSAEDPQPRVLEKKGGPQE